MTRFWGQSKWRNVCPIGKEVPEMCPAEVVQIPPSTKHHSQQHTPLYEPKTRLGTTSEGAAGAGVTLRALALGRLLVRFRVARDLAGLDLQLLHARDHLDHVRVLVLLATGEPLLLQGRLLRHLGVQQWLL